MICRDAQGFEVVVVELDFGAFDDRKALSDKSVHDVALGLRHGMEPPLGKRPRRKRYVDAPGGLRLLDTRAPKRLAFVIERTLELGLQQVGRPPGFFSLFLANLPERAQH